MEAAGHNIQVFAELLKPNFDSAEAADHLTEAIDTLQAPARQAMRTGNFQPSMGEIRKALGATGKALKFNQQAITAIQAGRTNDAIEAVLKAFHQKAKAGLVHEGAQPQGSRRTKGSMRAIPQLFDLDKFPPGIFADGVRGRRCQCLEPVTTIRDEQTRLLVSIALALQAATQPYSLNCFVRRGGETGRRTGLKILWASRPVWVRSPPSALCFQSLTGLVR